MSNVIPFTPRPRPQAEAPPSSGSTFRAHLEEAAHTVLDAADAIIAALDRLYGADEAEPSLTAKTDQAGQVVRFRGMPARTGPGIGPSTASEDVQSAPTKPQARPTILARRRWRRAG